jgi:hypothetical protein
VFLYWCLYFTKSEPIFKTNTNLTRGARGGLKRNLTLGERGNADKESGTLRVPYLAPSGTRTTNSSAPLSPPLRYGEPQKIKFAFSFFKKN